MILKEKIEKTAKGKCRFRREEKLGPQASLRVTPCPPAPNHTRGEVIRPPSQIKNNSYSVIRTREKKINRGKKVNTVAETKQFPTGGKRVLAGDFRSTENTTGFRIYS